MQFFLYNMSYGALYKHYHLSNMGAWNADFIKCSVVCE